MHPPSPGSTSMLPTSPIIQVWRQFIIPGTALNKSCDADSKCFKVLSVRSSSHACVHQVKQHTVVERIIGFQTQAICRAISSGENLMCPQTMKHSVHTSRMLWRGSRAKLPKQNWVLLVPRHISNWCPISCTNACSESRTVVD
jgi:hypothetical protein